MRKADNKLTPVEWELMEIIWKLGGSPSVREIIEAAYPNGEKAYTTVQTMVNVLVKKKLLSRKKTGLVNFYTPLLSREEIISKEMDHMVDRAFHGSIPALANHLFDAHDLNLEEIKTIKKLLEDKESKLKEK